MSVNDASRIIIDNSIVTLQIMASVTVYSRGIFYNHNMFISQATGLKLSIISRLNYQEF